MSVEIDIRHDFVSGKPDGADATVVRPSNWNAAHDVEVTADEGTLLGALPGSSGEVTDIPVGTGLAMTGGQLVSLAVIPIGGILDFGGTTAPAGWLLCDGSAVSRTTYAELFAVIDELFGVGDGVTTFNVPDLRGRVAAGRDGMGPAADAGRITSAGCGISGDIQGASGGSQNITLTVAQLPAHDHGAATEAAGVHKHQVVNVEATANAAPGLTTGQTITKQNVTSDNRDYILNGTTTAATLGDTSEIADHTHVITSQGDGEFHNNMQPTLIVTKIIYAGV